jgi:apolipoprotein D and lipocalin family protein
MIPTNSAHVLRKVSRSLVLRFLIGIAAAYWLVRLFILSPPLGIQRLDSVDLKQIQGPWFEVARLDSPLEKDLTNPMIFIKFSGSGSDSFYPYPDPADPRFRIVLMGQSTSGQRMTVLDKTTLPLDTYTTGTLLIPCDKWFPCAFHLIDYDKEGHTWMVVTGATKKQLWILSRGPGLLPAVLDTLKGKLMKEGYDLNALTYSNQLPAIPDVLPPMPQILPTPPGFKPQP